MSSVLLKIGITTDGDEELSETIKLGVSPMSSNTAMKVMGLGILIPSVALGLLPIMAKQTEWMLVLSDFTLTIAGHQIVHHVSSNGYTELMVNPVVWLAAAFGELIILMGVLYKPSRYSRFTPSR